MRDAWNNLLRIRRVRASMYELPIAQLTALTANLHRKTAEAFKLQDFLLLNDYQSAKPAAFSAEVAAVALQLKADDNYPPLLLTVWNEILASTDDDTEPPPTLAYHDDAKRVWVLAPRWESRNVRGGLVLVQGAISGEITLRDMQRPLLTYKFHLPHREGFGWIESDMLLISAES